MDLDELVARESIRDLVARYNAQADTGRFAEVMALFAPDAVMEAAGALHVGREGILAMFTGAADNFARQTTDAPDFLRHNTSTLQIDVDGATAKARSYYHVLTSAGLDHWGRYFDEFAVVDGQWRFARRKVTLDGAVPGGWAASLEASRGA